MIDDTQGIGLNRLPENNYKDQQELNVGMGHWPILYHNIKKRQHITPAFVWMEQGARLPGCLSSLAPSGDITCVRIFVLYILVIQEPVNRVPLICTLEELMGG